MPRFSANLWYLFPEMELADRFGAAAKAGFRAVEFHFPYAWPVGEFAPRLSEHGLHQAQINAPPGDWEAGERGLAGLPGRDEEFRDSIALAIEHASALDCPAVHVMAGVVPGDVERERATETLAQNLDFAATACAGAGIRVLIEPLNPRDVPGYLIGNTAEARAVMDAVGHDNIYLQFDLYHAAMNGEHLAEGVRNNLSVLGHMQVAGVPGRQEPDTKLPGGGVDFPALFETIDRIGYLGWIGCEYRPRAGTREGLGWALPYGIG